MRLLLGRGFSGQLRLTRARRALSPCGVPGQWRSSAAAPVWRVANRRTMPTTITSSAYPITGMKSGTMSIGRSRYTSSTNSHIRTPRGTSGSATSRRVRRTTSGPNRKASMRVIFSHRPRATHASAPISAIQTRSMPPRMLTSTCQHSILLTILGRVGFMAS